MRHHPRAVRKIQPVGLREQQVGAPVDDGIVRVLELSSQKVLQWFAGHTGGTNCLALLGDNNTLTLQYRAELASVMF